jgi:hypothetical protein
MLTYLYVCMHTYSHKCMQHSFHAQHGRTARSSHIRYTRVYWLNSIRSHYDGIDNGDICMLEHYSSTMLDRHTVLDRELNQELPTVATSAASVVDGLTK